MRNVVVARDPAAARAAQSVVEDGANAVDMAVAGALAGAVRASSSALLGGCGLLVVGTGMGRHWIDGRPRAPGLGEARRKTPENPPAHWGAAVPGFFPGLFAAHARFGSMPLTQLARAAAAAVKEEEGWKALKPRLEFMEAVSRQGLPGIERTGVMRAVLSAVGPAADGLFTEDDLVHGPAPVRELVPCCDEGFEVYTFPRSVPRWGGASPDPLPALGADAVVTCDKLGVFCAASWLVAPEGVALEGAPGITLGDLLPLPRKGIARWKPGGSLPVPFALGVFAQSSNAFSAFALTGRGDLVRRGDALLNARMEASGTAVRVGDGEAGAVWDAKALWVQRALQGDRVIGDVIAVE